jgi:hypothetical protein
MLDLKKKDGILRNLGDFLFSGFESQCLQYNPVIKGWRMNAILFSKIHLNSELL